MSESSADDMLTEAMGQFYSDPLGFVMFAFPWETEISIRMVKLVEPWKSRYDSEFGPDAWACQFLDDLGDEVKKRGFKPGMKGVNPIQFSTASGHGIGKSCLVAMIILWIMSTRPNAKGIVTANTSEQLRTKTWSELGKWLNYCITGHWFLYSAGRATMSLAHKENKTGWRVDGQTCREENSESFAGLHAADSTPFYIFDEASAIPDKIFEVREGGTTDGEPMTFDFGNPTRNSGQFFENCIGDDSHKYHVRSIDSRNVAITNKTRINQWVEDYGVDSDFVKVRVRGVFPSVGSMQFIGRDDVHGAQERQPIEDRGAPLVIGVDVARFGDDESVIYTRIGDDAATWPIQRFRGLNTIQLAERVAMTVRDFGERGYGCSGLFVDGGGGYGGGVVDQLRQWGFNPIEVIPGAAATDTDHYRYRGDEMWGRMRQAINTRLALPRGTRNADDLAGELTKREFSFTPAGGKIFLEPKKDMKARGIGSPDIADALALTYAGIIKAVPGARGTHVSRNQTLSDYDPLEVKW